MKPRAIRLLAVGFAVAGIILVIESASAANPAEPPAGANAKDILRDASRIASIQKEHERFWTERVLLHIGAEQMRG